MLCPSCHTQNRDNAKFCKGCGLSFPPELLATSVAQAQDSLPQAPSATQDGAGEHATNNPLDSHVETSHVPTPTSTTPAANSVQTQPSQEPEQPSPPAEGEDEEDISLAPTQILSPQQMLSYQARRWQHELERERRISVGDISDIPTRLSPFESVPASTAEPAQASSESVTQPENSTPAPEPAATPEVSASSTVDKKTAPETEAPRQEEHGKSRETSDTEVPPVQREPEAAPEQIEPEVATVDTTVDKKEEIMESQPPVAAEQAQPEQPEGTFPTLAIGTSLLGRYRITQVLEEGESEHTYQILDTQGYQHCWNCGSEENAEGDQFCIACGAELTNASYTLHEYPASGSTGKEAHVLQGAIVTTFVEQGHTYVVEQPQPAQAAFPHGVHLLVAAQSDAGDVRRSEPNEDSTLVLHLERVHESVSTPIGVYIVADGLGGHANGQAASRMAIGTISERMVRELLLPPLSSEKAGEAPQPQDEEQLITLLQGAVEEANTALCQANQREKSDMGSTITGFMIVGDHAYILNVGDSRTYIQRDGNLYQLTNDHSLVGQMVAGGLIEPDDVYTHPQRSQIYRSLGDKPNVQVDIFKQQIHPGDILLSCSDGLWEMVRNPQISDILKNASDPQMAATQLVDAANANGGEDNVSAVVVFVRS